MLPLMMRLCVEPNSPVADLPQQATRGPSLIAFQPYHPTPSHLKPSPAYHKTLHHLLTCRKSSSCTTTTPPPLHNPETNKNDPPNRTRHSPPDQLRKRLGRTSHHTVMEHRPVENQTRARHGHPALVAAVDAQIAGSGGDSDRGGG